jgi:DNA-binding XRE family transcriptional regulator
MKRGMREAYTPTWSAWFRGLLAHEACTQKMMADRLEVHRITVVRWANGQTLPPLEIRIELNRMAERAGYRPLPLSF